MTSIISGNLQEDVQSVAVIMAGGQGTRFWPASRRSCPKQFLPLAGAEESLIGATADRLEKLVGKGGLLVVTAAEQAALVEERLPGVAVLSEPMGRNTAPCIAFAAQYVLDAVGDVPMLCLPADHHIRPVEPLLKVLKRGLELAASEDVLLTFGIEPRSPETGYGYIQSGAVVSEGEIPAMAVKRFVEKPDLDAAASYLASGDYYWNSGMFAWRPSVILQAIASCVPNIASGLPALQDGLTKRLSAKDLSSAYAALPSVSIDVGVMEKANNVVVLPARGFDWNDVGSWAAWAQTASSEAPGPGDGNLAEGDACLIDCRGSVVVSKERFVAAVGLEDVIVVETEDAVLVCRKDRAQDVKRVVEHLKNQKRDQLL